MSWNIPIELRVNPLLIFYFMRILKQNFGKRMNDGPEITEEDIIENNNLKIRYNL